MFGQPTSRNWAKRFAIELNREHSILGIVVLKPKRVLLYSVWPKVFGLRFPHPIAARDKCSFLGQTRPIVAAPSFDQGEKRAPKWESERRGCCNCARRSAVDADRPLLVPDLASLAAPVKEALMDALPISPGELLCLGSSLAFSGLFYYLHRKKAKVVTKIQEAPKLQVSDSLPSILSATGGNCLRYVAIEGVVQPAEAALTSPYHKELQGVIERLVLKEHRLIWNSLARSWTDSERVVLEQVHTVPFVLASPSGAAAAGQVSVESPLHAVELPLETVYERFQQTSHGFKDLVSHYLSGEKPKGFLETEEMLLVGSSLTGIGELALRPDGSLHLQPPADGTGYFLRLGDWQTLLAELESASSFWRWATFLCGLAAAAVLLHALCRAYRRHQLKQKEEAERRVFEDLRLHKSPALELSDEVPESTCVICLTKRRECVLLPCGHVCCCFSCFQALRSRSCPICRGPIDRVVPLYQA